jgi:hypothetical protein
LKPLRLPNGLLALAVLTSGAGGCYDPVHNDAVAALGPETGVEIGPKHRAGQPCLTCHTSDGPADLELSVAGTLFTVRGTTTPLVNGTVTVIDASGQTRTAKSNEAGNFFIKRSDWDPGFPLTIAIEAEGIKRSMTTTVGRDGGCGACHRGAGDATYMPGVFLRDQ